MKTLIQKPLITFLIATTTAIILSISLNSYSVDEQLINLTAQQELPYLSLDNEPPFTKGVLLSYTDNQALVLAAWTALKQYPKTAEQAFVLYGQEPEFKQALLQYGVGIIPVIDYFLTNEITSLTAQETLSNLWQNLQQGEINTSHNIAQLTPQQRGWYAVNYINQDGYNFLGQFALDKDGNAQWIQSDRMVKTLASLFTSGIRDLETKYKTDAEITSGDILWAGADVVALASGLKLLKASKAVTSSKLATTEKSLTVAQKTGLFSSKLIKNKSIQGLLKYTAIGTTAYIAITHPSIISSLLDELANEIGINPVILKITVGSIVLFLLLQPLMLAMRPLLFVIGKITKT